MPATPESRSNADEHLAMMLMTTWSLRTGREVPLVPPEGLTEQELIDFWSEDLDEDDPGPPFGRDPGPRVASCCGPSTTRRGSQS